MPQPLPVRLPGTDRSTTLAAAAVLLVAAFLIRAPQFGNPVIQIDEQFYTLVGHRMLTGSLPYVDIWDRKPVGLFAVYALVQAIGGPGALAGQVAAALFAAATALVIARLATRSASGLGGVAAGLLYLVWLDMLGGDGGQSPVFYNLPVALSALLTLRLWEADRPSTARIAFTGAASMLLIGLAMQIKYPAMFEGCFFGLALLAVSHRAGLRSTHLAGLAVLWIGSALAPTLLALAIYAALGHADAFIAANFQSIFLRTEPDHGAAFERLLTIAAIIAPLAIAAGLGLRLAARTAPRPTTFLRGWCTAAVLGFLLFGSWYIHYALPLLVPLAVAGAPLFASRRGLALAALLATAGLVADVLIVEGNIRSRGDGQQVRALANTIRPRLEGGTLYVFYGDPALYDLTGSPLPTRFAFPSHLNHRKEADALGISRDAELARVLAAEPRFIVTAAPLPSAVDPASVAMVEARLARGYRLVASVPLGRSRSLVYEAVGPAQRTRQAPSNSTSARPL